MKSLSLVTAVSILGLAACHRAAPPTPAEQHAEISTPEAQQEVSIEPEPAQPAAQQPESPTPDGLRALFPGGEPGADLVEWLNALGVAREANDESWNRFVQAVQADPQRAVGLLQKTPAFPLLDDLYSLFASVIAQKDPAFARQWAETAPDEMKASIAAGLLSAWGGADPKAAAQWLTGNPLLREDVNCTEALVKAWAASDPGAAANWAFQQPAGDGLDSAIQALGHSWGGSDSNAAIAFLQKQAASATRDDFASALAEGWAERDANAAVTWYLSTPMHDEASREEPLYSLFSALAGQDVSKAEQQVDSMAWGGSRDSAIRGIIDTVVVDDPKQAVVWANRISDAETRATTVQSLITELSDRAPDLVKQLEQMPMVGK